MFKFRTRKPTLFPVTEDVIHLGFIPTLTDRNLPVVIDQPPLRLAEIGLDAADRPTSNVVEFFPRRTRVALQDQTTMDHPAFEALLAVHEGRWEDFDQLMLDHPAVIGDDVRKYAAEAARQGRKDQLELLKMFYPSRFGEMADYAFHAQNGGHEDWAAQLLAA